MKETSILYHADCPDGFGSAYSAWKKFGDSASYIPVAYLNPQPLGLEGKEVYLLDFCYKKGEMEELQRVSKSLVVLDHHIGSKEVVESIKEHVYSDTGSGAGLSWRYFHPDTAVPKLIQYVEDHDVHRYALPYSHEIGSVIHMEPFNFLGWDTLVKTLESEAGFKEMLVKGTYYQEHYHNLAEIIALDAEEVEIAEHTILAVNTHHKFSTEVAGILMKKKPPFALTWAAGAENNHFSLRGEGDIDLSVIAKQFGGGGHKYSAGFWLPSSAPLPFKKLQK